MIVIGDSSILIPLARINQLHLLEEMYGGVFIPQGIYDEVVIRGAGKVGSEEELLRRTVRRRGRYSHDAIGNPFSCIFSTAPERLLTQKGCQSYETELLCRTCFFCSTNCRC